MAEYLSLALRPGDEVVVALLGNGAPVSIVNSIKIPNEPPPPFPAKVQLTPSVTAVKLEPTPTYIPTSDPTPVSKFLQNDRATADQANINARATVEAKNREIVQTNAEIESRTLQGDAAKIGCAEAEAMNAWGRRVDLWEMEQKRQVDRAVAKIGAALDSPQDAPLGFEEHKHVTAALHVVSAHFSKLKPTEYRHYDVLIFSDMLDDHEDDYGEAPLRGVDLHGARLVAAMVPFPPYTFNPPGSAQGCVKCYQDLVDRWSKRFAGARNGSLTFVSTRETTSELLLQLLARSTP